MSHIHVISPGFVTTVQDLGRYGYAHLGVSASGAADRLSLRMGNALLGNPESAAALEMTLAGGAFEFDSETSVVFTGSDFNAQFEGNSVPPYVPFRVRAGQAVQCGATRSGARCYLCVRGGIEVPLVLGSASTHLMTGLGGLEGRALKKGDLLKIGNVTTKAFQTRLFDRDVLSRLMPQKVLRITPGPQGNWFRDGGKSLFQGTYRVTEESNRMGLRLHGPPLEQTYSGQMLTEGVSLGAVQAPKSGQPILLFVEHQTTGGYPKIANVISADLHSVGQLRPRDEVRFELVSMEHALSLLREQERLLGSS